METNMFLVVTAAFGGAFVGTLATHALVPAPALKESFVAAEKMEQVPGLKTTYEILKPGQGGTAITKGSQGTLHATGVVKESGGVRKKFWSTKDPGQQPFTCQYGVGQVITGWDQGCLGMTVGEERKLTIPADEGYGAKGFPAWGIPPGATLEFTLECLKIQ